MNNLYYFAKAINKDFKWIAMDDDGTVVLSRSRPVKVDGSWEDGYGTSCIDINTEEMYDVFKGDMFSDLGKDKPINLDNIRDERYAEFTNEDLMDIHRALKTQEKFYAENDFPDFEVRYFNLAKRVLNAVRCSKGQCHIGERGVSLDGVGMEIVAWMGKTNITIRFDNGKALHRQSYRNFKNGKIYYMSPSKEDGDSDA